VAKRRILPSIVSRKLEAVKQKKNEIEQLSIELASIDDRDNEILGTKAEVEQSRKWLFLKTMLP